MQGIWPPGATLEDLNCLAWSNDDDSLAVGDDASLVRLYKYPATKVCLFALNCCLPSTAVCPQLLFALRLKYKYPAPCHN